MMSARIGAVTWPVKAIVPDVAAVNASGRAAAAITAAPDSLVAATDPRRFRHRSAVRRSRPRAACRSPPHHSGCARVAPAAPAAPPHASCACRHPLRQPRHRLHPPRHRRTRRASRARRAPAAPAAPPAAPAATSRARRTAGRRPRRARCASRASCATGRARCATGRARCASQPRPPRHQPRPPRHRPRPPRHPPRPPRRRPLPPRPALPPRPPALEPPRPPPGTAVSRHRRTRSCSSCRRRQTFPAQPIRTAPPVCVFMTPSNRQPPTLSATQGRSLKHSASSIRDTRRCRAHHHAASTRSIEGGVTWVSRCVQPASPTRRGFQRSSPVRATMCRPPLSWSGAPAGTRSFALGGRRSRRPRPARAQDDVGALGALQPAGRHDARSPKASRRRRFPAGTREGVNDWKRTGYNGPCPPDRPPPLLPQAVRARRRVARSRAADQEQLEDAMRGHVLAEAQLVGTYEKVTPGRRRIASSAARLCRASSSRARDPSGSRTHRRTTSACTSRAVAPLERRQRPPHVA